MHGYFFYLFIGGYLIGSVPFAYLLTKRKHGLDIRKVGSGNVGARNAFEVTRSRSTGIIVLLLDVLKGFVPLYAFELLYNRPAGLPWLAFGLVLGHCYPVWLRFQGGRGLATSAGILILISPQALVLWLAAYFVSSKIRPQVHLNAMIALLVVALAAVSVPDRWIEHSTFYLQLPAPIIREGVLFLFIVLFSRHAEPVWQYAQTLKPKH